MNWTKEKAWEWYNSYPWLRGCNFIGSDCANRRDMWQSYHSQEHLTTAERELKLAHDIGFNTVRLIIDFDVWYQEPESFMNILEKYVKMCDEHGQYVMFVLTSEAELPRGNYDEFVPLPLGPQEYALGYHQGRSPEVLAKNADKSNIYHPLESPVLRESFLQMLRQIVNVYKDDKRILCWNVYNEPGIYLKERAVPILKTVFEEVRKCKPIQPLTAEVWDGIINGKATTKEQQIALDYSDVISFHCYRALPEMCRQIMNLKQYGRPILCTEWLNRMQNSTVESIFPVFCMEKIGCWCWGLVVGKTQTNEPWYVMFEEYKAGTLKDADFTKWLHDLFRASLLPYNPKEIELIQSVCKTADEIY